jgi:required for meiotic nuclear division protein 1
MVTAFCAAEQFNIPKVIKILQREGYEIDPYRTGLLPQVVHIQIPLPPSDEAIEPKGEQTSSIEYGDVFIFPSGTVVAWSVPEALTSHLISKVLLPAAENAHLEQLETEDLEYLEDPSRENSSIKGDIIFLGTRLQESRVQADVVDENTGAPKQQSDMDFTLNSTQRGVVDTILAKIAFSSGLARSTKLAVLESLLSNYFDSTRSIPTLLSRGSRLPFTRSFILRKTGQLLSVRAQLNLYSELTDSLPDIFWDSRHELGLEGYYDQVGRALDVGVRIKTLNEKMDYAQEIASVLRERLSERHGLVLEWMIIALIAVEVGFEILRLWKEKQERDVAIPEKN